MVLVSTSVKSGPRRRDEEEDGEAQGYWGR